MLLLLRKLGPRDMRNRQHTKIISSRHNEGGKPQILAHFSFSLFLLSISSQPPKAMAAPQTNILDSATVSKATRNGKKEKYGLHKGLVIWHRIKRTMKKTIQPVFIREVPSPAFCDIKGKKKGANSTSST